MAETVERTNGAAETITESKIRPEDIHMPSSSYWPIILAFGFSCIVGGLALNLSVTLIGVIITLVATIGWVIEPVHTGEGH
jgi:cytochrome c oxidase subunit 1